MCTVFDFMYSWLINYTCTNFGEYWKKISTIIINHKLLVSKKLWCCSYHRDCTFYADHIGFTFHTVETVHPIRTIFKITSLWLMMGKERVVLETVTLDKIIWGRGVGLKIIVCCIRTLCSICTI